MSTMLVTSEDLNSFATQIKASQSEIQAVFDQMKSRMNYAGSIWQSPASTSLQEQFASLEPVFGSYIQVLENYVQYLNSTAAAYHVEEEGYKKYPFYKGLLRIFPVFRCADEGDTRPFEQTQYKKR